MKKSGFKNAVQPSFLDMINFVNMISKIFIFALTLSLSNAGWGSSNDPGKVLLRDVQVLTLKSGQMTTGMYLLRDYSRMDRKALAFFPKLKP